MYNTHMNTQNITRRPDHGCILIWGPQAEIFLQGQLTCDVKSCPTFGGYCNTQGRLISLFRLLQNPLEQDKGYCLECPLEILESTLHTLKKYAIFSKVTIENISQISENIPELDIGTQINQLQTLDILSKTPQLTSKTQGMFLPHHVNLPELKGVSFNKGCYLGQEIIARMEYRSKIKKHLAIFEYDFDLQSPLEAGSAIYHPDHTEPVGHIVNTSKTLILASVLDEHCVKELRVSSITLRPHVGE